MFAGLEQELKGSIDGRFFEHFRPVYDDDALYASVLVDENPDSDGRTYAFFFELLARFRRT